MKRFSVAPMLDWTTPECRALHRIFSPEALLYSEMISSGAIVYGDAERHLAHFADEPCVLQLGGSKPEELRKAVEIAQQYNYQEINLNVGCPSDRVQNNSIGAVLMKNPDLVIACLEAMSSASNVPISIKHRLGIDEQDERDVLNFIEKIATRSACRTFIVHARKAWLKGLSPKENREIPPLNYDLVYEIKKRFPELIIELNGGINSIEECKHHLEFVDGVMLGRAVYQNPQLLLQVPCIFAANPRNLNEVISKISELLEKVCDEGKSLSAYTRHLLGLFQACPGAKKFRQILSEETRNNNDFKIWLKALAAVSYAN